MLIQAFWDLTPIIGQAVLDSGGEIERRAIQDELQQLRLLKRGADGGKSDA